MNKSELLEKIINEMSKVPYSLSDEAMSDGLTRFFHVYRETPKEFKWLALEQSAKLIGCKDLVSMQEEFKIGESLYEIPGAECVTLNIDDNFFAFYGIYLKGKHDEKWIKNNLESATRKYFPEVLYPEAFNGVGVKEIIEYDSYNLLKRGILNSEEFKCYSWADEKEGLYNSLTFAVSDNAFPEADDEIPF
ncbi:MAG: hypothetical protein PVJ67_00040 [Candidatus Pacearchaeota archaeon]|jgi:hypothetical protein